MATEGSSIHSVDTLNKGVIHVLGRMEWDGTRFHYATHNVMQFKTCNYLFLEFSINIPRLWLMWVTETMECETVDKGDYCGPFCYMYKYTQ